MKLVSNTHIMKHAQPLLVATAITLPSMFSGAMLAQTSPNQDAMAMSAKLSLTDGEVRKIDKEAGKLTIRHGEIKHLETPSMTMMFVAKDRF